MRYLYLVLIFVLSSQLISAQMRPDGPFKDYHDNGELMLDGQYKNGKRHGEWRAYNKEGTLVNISSFTNGKKDIPEITYYGDGSLKRKIEKEGTVFIERSYYKTGSLFYERAYKSGYYKEFTEDSTLLIEANYLDFQLYGKWKRYYDNGNVEWSVSYERGSRNGIYQNYYDNGQLKVQGIILKGQKKGEEKRYDEAGNLIWKGYYENNEFSKTWVKYDADGKKIKKVNTKKEQIDIEPTEVPDGNIEKIAFHPACKDVFGNMELKKCTNLTINGHIIQNFDLNKAKNLGLQGRQRIMVYFIVDPYGYVSIRNIKAPHPVLRIETQRVMQMLPKFEPAYQRGEPVAMPFSIPIVFSVE